MNKALLFILGIVLLWSSAVFAAHPLITDDTGTQGQGKFQFEFNVESSHNSEQGVTEKETHAAATLTYGATDSIDIVMGLPWLKAEVEGGGPTKAESGLSDMSIAVKWRFFEHDDLSFALKPGITVPTGDEGRGLGSGKTTYSAFFITTKELKPFTAHLNLGYIRNENKLDERVDLWHVSLAGEYAAAKSLRIVANIGQESNPDKDADSAPAFILAGMIYSVTESLDIDLGYKRGLNNAGPDYMVLAGITLRF